MGPSARVHATCRRNGFCYKVQGCNLICLCPSFFPPGAYWRVPVGMWNESSLPPPFCTTRPFYRPVDDAIGFHFLILPPSSVYHYSYTHMSPFLPPLSPDPFGFHRQAPSTIPPPRYPISLLHLPPLLFPSVPIPAHSISTTISRPRPTR